jgi:hypothetical protein
VSVRRQWASLLTVAVLMYGCHASRRHNIPAKVPFIAFESDFTNFESWQCVDSAPHMKRAKNHGSGKTHEYLNQAPSKGTKEFPPGTIFVKTMEDGVNGNKIFAMAKRGGGYNPDGATEWEWFELSRRRDGSFAIVWRGVDAPGDHAYAADLKGAGCNSCHRGALRYDFVHATGFVVPRF